jgi:hypothetical protein
MVRDRARLQGPKRFGFLAAFAFLNDAGNLKTHLLGPLVLVGMEIARADGREAQQDNTGKQCPSGGGIEAV